MFTNMVLKNHMARRMHAAAVCWLALSGTSLAFAQWPEKPIHLVVPYSAGGGVDNIARIVNPLLTKSLGQPIIIDNRPGANANIGSDYVAKAKADGSTFLIGATYLAANRAGMSGLTYDALKDLVPVARLGSSPALLVVSAASSIHTVDELILQAKAHPSDASYGAVGTASPNALLFVRNTGIPAISVLYKGGAQALPDLISQRVMFMITTVSEALPHVRAGRLRALAVTGSDRLKALPEVPTMAQAGIANLTSVGWWGVFAPAGTPTAAVNRMSAVLNEAVRQPDAVAAMACLGIDPAPMAADAFGRFYKSEMDFYAETAKTFNLRQN